MGSPSMSSNELLTIVIIGSVISLVLAFFTANFGFHTEPKVVTTFRSSASTFQPETGTLPAITTLPSTTCQSFCQPTTLASVSRSGVVRTI